MVNSERYTEIDPDTEDTDCYTDSHMEIHASLERSFLDVSLGLACSPGGYNLLKSSVRYSRMGSKWTPGTIKLCCR
jgi:hypothetical protein